MVDTGQVVRPALAADTETLPTRLRVDGADYDKAVQELHALVLRAARHHASRTPGVRPKLGAKRIEDAVMTAANEATMAVLRKLDTFEGRSRFSTWVFKFGVLHASVELRRAAWRGTDINLESLGEQASAATTPEQHVEVGSLADAVRDAMSHELTAHQRAIATALLIEEVPIDVLADRLGSTRNALYKTLHDVRKKLRSSLVDRGLLAENAFIGPVAKKAVM